MGNLFTRELPIDILVKGWLDKLDSSLFDQIFIFFSFLGSLLAFIILALLGMIFFIKYKKYLEGIFVYMSLLISWVSMYYLKLLFNRERPPGEKIISTFGASFPSGHAMIATVFYGFITYLVLDNLKIKRRKLTMGILGGLIFFIGISRVYFNVHYTTDIIAGYFFGGVLLFIIIAAYKLIRNK
jgi:undecaprenyl-diphosphatase